VATRIMMVVCMPTTVAGGGRKCCDFCGRWGFDEAQVYAPLTERKDRCDGKRHRPGHSDKVSKILHTSILLLAQSCPCPSSRFSRLMSVFNRHVPVASFLYSLATRKCCPGRGRL
jgi:hypothetical protein